MDKKVGKVYILGGGAGDFELLTLKGKRYIENADCVVYDRLVNPIIVRFANKNAELIYLGKENTEGGVIQEEINRTIVEKALLGKNVVRLKGGDPFVFGRGGEEIEELVKNNIDFEIIPGISSSIAVPEYAGIPVTHRGVSKSFHVFTGMTSKDNKFHNFENLSKLDGTLIFLMGIKNLELITSELIKYGKNKETKVAIIERGTLGTQRVTEGNLENIYKISLEREVIAPAIIIIGDVVEKRKIYNWFEKKPLSGKKILVTRALEEGNEFCKKIERLGGESILLPMIEIEDNMEKFDYNKLKEYQGLMFNSPNAIKYFFRHLKDIRILGNLKIGVVGEKTKEELEKFKIQADIMPSEYQGEKLAEKMVEITEKYDKILIITSDRAPIEIEKLNEKYNRTYEKLVCYKNKSKDIPKKILEENMKKSDYITLFSASTAENVIKCLESDFNSLKNTKIISIGPSTSKILKKFKINDFIQSDINTGDGIIDKLK